MIKVSIADQVARVVLDRPRQRNAMSQALVRELMTALERLEADQTVGAVLLGGAGPGFCAGSDLAMLAAMSPAERSAFEDESGRLARAISGLRLPIVAVVTGFAIGGGLTLAAACDIVVTAPSAKWSLPETPIGLFPAWGLGLLTDRVGLPLARRLAWGIDELDGVTAARVGLADVPAEDAWAEAESLGARLAALPRAQARAVKEFFRHRPSAEEADWLANSLFMRMSETPEAEASFRKYGKPAAAENRG